jgi:hypothetical protein
MGGANLNFEVRLRGGYYYFKNIKKYHENQREKLILMVFFSISQTANTEPKFLSRKPNS